MALENGGFELGYRPDFDQYGNKPVHTAYVFEVNITGGPITKRYTVERGEIHNPAGWWSWYAHQRNSSAPVPWDPNNTLGWCEPEIRVSDPTHARHRSGSHAGYLFTYRRIHEGGLFQQVQVTPGARYRFTAFGHAWISNDDSQPPSCSLPGCGALAYPVGAAGLNDDQRSVRLYVGIDPLGGNNPYSQSVVWSDGWHIFNAYREEPLSAEAVAQNDTITVYLLSSTLWPVIHNDVAWDDCTLEMVDVPEPCRGKPRVQYARVVNVLPPTVTPERAAAVFSSCWAQGRQTVTGSYDDAGIGDLDERKAVLWDIPQADEGVFVGWYAEHYPGVVVKFAGHAEGDPLRLTYPTTYHPPTITSPYGPRGTGFHYGLDLRSSWNLWQSEALAAHDGTVILAGTEEGKEYFGTQVQVRALTAHGEIITRYAHLINADNGGVYVRVGQRVLAGTPLGRCDNTGQSTGDHLHFDVRLNGAYTDPEPLIDFPNAPPEPPTPPNNEGQLLGLHLQSIEPGALEFLSGVGPNVTKVVADQGAILPVNAASPRSFVVYRHHLTREDELACLADPVNRARWFIDQFYEQIAPLVDAARVDYVETAINETMDGDKVPAAIAFEHAFIDELARRIPQARPLVATIAVGNPHESQFPLLVPLASHTIQHGGAFGYHAYWPVDHGRSYLLEQWDWHAGRFEGMDAVIRDALGYGVPWLLSECGACGWDAATNAYDPAAGWKHPACFAGNWQDYKRDLLQFAGLLKVSPARVLGSTLFTVCPPSWGWDYFTLDAAQLAELADALK